MAYDSTMTGRTQERLAVAVVLGLLIVFVLTRQVVIKR